MVHDDTEAGWASFRHPNTLVGIGGAGKAVVDRFVSREWIIPDAFRTIEESGGFRAYILDTATDERDADEARVAEHNDRTEAVAERHGTNPDLLDIDVHYRNPLDYVPEPLRSRSGLTADESVERILDSTAVREWWLTDDEAMVTDDYATGTDGRRALAAALLHASQVGGEPMVEPVGPPGTRDMTIVAGLGGGTGSGMAIDLAKLNARDAQITLVGILPSADESDERLANAFAALSELEYLAVNDENPFRNVILLPYGPAADLDHDGPFLDSVVRTILARENLVGHASYLNESSPVAIPKRFAPFTVAVPQTLRYDVGTTRAQENAIYEYRQAKREALDTELKLYEALSEFLIAETEASDALEAARNGFTVDDERFALSDEKASALRDRLDDLRSWIENTDQFGSVDNSALITWRNRLGRWIADERRMCDDRPEEEIEKRLVSRVPERVQTLGPVDDLYVGEPVEQEVAGVLRDELRAIGYRADLFRARELLESDVERQAIAAAMNPDGDLRTATWQLRAAIDELRHRYGQRKADLATLDDVEADLVAERWELVGSWENAVIDDLEPLVAIDAHAEELRELLDDLETGLERAVREIETADTPAEVSVDVNSFEFGRLDYRLRAVGLDPVGGDAIRRSVDQAVRAFEAWYEYNRSGLVGRITGRQSAAADRYRDHVAAIDDRFLAVRPTADDEVGGEFYCRALVSERVESAREALEEKRTAHREALAAELERLLSEADVSRVADQYRDQWVGGELDIERDVAPEEAYTRVREVLADGLDADSVREALGDLSAEPGPDGDAGVVRAVLDDALLAPVERKRAEVEAAVSAIDERVARHERLEDVVETLGGQFDGTGPRRPDVDGDPQVRADADSPSLTKVSPDDQLMLHQYEDVADAGVWSEPKWEDERYKIRRYFEKRFAESVVRTPERRGFDDGQIDLPHGADGEYADARSPTYDGHYVLNVFLSRAFDADMDPDHPMFDRVREVFEGSKLHFREAESGYHHASVDCGDPWDFSMVSFVSGVFLDNIHGIERYREAYERQRDELGDLIRVRHTHGLDGLDPNLGAEDDAGYVYRQSLLDLDDPDDVYTLLDATEEELADRLREEYIGSSTFSNPTRSE